MSDFDAPGQCNLIDLRVALDHPEIMYEERYSLPPYYTRYAPSLGIQIRT